MLDTTHLAKKVGVSRVTMIRYLHDMEASGRLLHNTFGTAKAYFLVNNQSSVVSRSEDETQL